VKCIVFNQLQTTSADNLGRWTTANRSLETWVDEQSFNSGSGLCFFASLLCCYKRIYKIW